MYASASPGDNFGIASYGVVLNGPISTLDHKSINTLAASGPNGISPVGFTLLRSADNVTTILASQDTTLTTPNLIRGIGQTSGSLASNGITSFINPVEGDPWNAHFLIASGTYSGSSFGISINTASADTFANVFVDNSSKAVSAASVSAGTYCLDCVRVQSATLDNVVANDPGTIMATLTASSNFVPGPYTWSFYYGFSYQPAPGATGSGPAVQPTIDPATGKFSWNTVGSPLGTYSWPVLAENGLGGGIGSVTVKLTAVPEPAMVSLLGMALVGGLGFIRPRRTA